MGRAPPARPGCRLRTWSREASSLALRRTGLLLLAPCLRLSSILCLSPRGCCEALSRRAAIALRRSHLRRPDTIEAPRADASVGLPEGLTGRASIESVAR